VTLLAVRVVLLNFILQTDSMVRRLTRRRLMTRMLAPASNDF